MPMAPILLQCAPTTQELDQAGTMVDKRVLPTYNPGHYTPKLLPDHVKPLDTLDYVPPLEYFCIKYLYPDVELTDLGGLSRLPFHPEAHMAWLKGLIPFFTSDMRDVDLKYVDPRLWGTLIQLYSSLPPFFYTYTLPLSDTHLTQLQAIRSTPDFTLITVLDLSSRREITDETIGELKPLKNLCVLDLSLTCIGAWGVKKLSMCLVRNHQGKLGPWGIRIWSLRGCKNVDDSVKDALARFPLLSVVDLRDTAVTPFSHFPGFTSRPPSTYTTIYYPNPPLSWVNGLCQAFPGCRIFQSSDMDSLYVLHINKLEYPTIYPQSSIRGGMAKVKRVGEHDRVLALFPSGRQALDTTHHLSQDLDQGGRPATRLSENPRKANRQSHDVYLSDNSHDYGFDYVGDASGSEYGDYSKYDASEGDGSGYDRRDDDLSEDSQSESNLSEDHTDDSYSESNLSEEDHAEDDRSESNLAEYGQDPQDAGSINGPFDVTPRVSLEHLMSRREPYETHNELAALVMERQAAEKEACRFYSQHDYHQRSRARQVLAERNDMTRGIAYTTEPVQLSSLAPVSLPPSRQWSQMFFRQPPAYDSISHDSAPETEQVHRTKPDEPIFAKKRKTGAGGACFPMTLLNRQAVAGDRGGREVMSAACSQSGFRGSGPPSASMNPFLAKVRRPSQAQSLATLHLIPPTPQGGVATTSGLATSTMQARSELKSHPPSHPPSQRKSKPSTVSVMSAAANSRGSRTIQMVKRDPGSKKSNQTFVDAKAKTVKTKQGQIKQTFDMRAWVLQTNR